ncbi:unnamed protein product [Phytophthora lilii]|uniref:Unnamed protein product n=1 Tax=Phytophthora lilii TaxID=2077276 RepID=A0A9W6XHM6_9STRA|nr:unnamed protein product [Phytophthora lilii]
MMRWNGVVFVAEVVDAHAASSVQPRDLVFVGSTGILTRSNGDRIGYQLLHSVNLDGYSALPERSLACGRIRAARFFERHKATGELLCPFEVTWSNTATLLDSAALKAASTGFLSSWNAVKCCHVNKLMWFLENRHLVSGKEDAAARARGPDARTLSHASTSFDGLSGFHLRSISLTSPNDRCGGACGRNWAVLAVPSVDVLQVPRHEEPGVRDLRTKT